MTDGPYQAVYMSWYDSGDTGADQREESGQAAATMAATTMRQFVFNKPASSLPELRPDKKVDIPATLMPTEKVSGLSAVDRQEIQYQPVKSQLTASRDLGKSPLFPSAYSVDQSFLQLKQLEGPTSASSRWMFNNRPDLAHQFNSDACSLQIGSQPDGTVFKILTSPEGNRWMLTAKGSATVETLASSTGQVLFKNSGRASVTG